MRRCVNRKCPATTQPVSAHQELLSTAPSRPHAGHPWPGLTQVIHADVHLEAVHCLGVRTHHHAGVVDENVKLVDL